MRVAAIVVNWNGGEKNLACLASLARQGPALGRVYFVDNASDDDSVARVQAAHPDVVLIRSDTNLGYGGGNNLAAQRAASEGFEALWIVNNDVVVPDGQLDLLVAALASEPTVGIVGPRVLQAQDPTRVWACGGALTWRENLTTLIGSGERDGPEWQRTSEVDYVVGCCLLARTELLSSLGGFDDAYFAYTEDVDLGLRAREAGFRSLCVGEARCLHAPSSSTGGGYNARRKYMMGVNSVWFLRRWGGPKQWLSFLLFDVLTLPFVWLAGLASGRGRAVLAKAWGILDGLRGRRVDARTVAQGRRFLWPGTSG